MAENKSSASARSSSTKRKSGTSTAAKRPTAAKSASNGAKRSTTAKSGSKRQTSRATTKRSTSRTSSAAANGRKTSSPSPAASSSNHGGLSATVKHAASKAKGPAVAIGAAAAGVAGGLALKSRQRRKTVLGVPVPRALGKGMPDLDPKAIAKSVGQASKQFAKTTKNVSKDLERAGDQAERIGKILD
jgi:RNA polymerase primary sigma factor